MCLRGRRFFFDRGVANSPAPAPFATIGIIKADDAFGAARLSATKALNAGTNVQWAFPGVQFCASASMVNADVNLVYEAQAMSIGGGLEATLVPHGNEDLTGFSATSFTELCGKNIAENSLILTDSKEIWRAMKELGVEPLGMAYSTSGGAPRF